MLDVFPRRLAVAALLVITSAPIAGAQFDTTGWRMQARDAHLTTFAGRTALSIRDGVAWLPASSVADGTIEFDMAVRDTFGFAGVQFHMRDLDNYEHFYLRSHLSGNPDATQYEPVFNGNAGWQIYIGDRYMAPIRFKRDEWMHIKLEIQGSRAAVYIDGDTAVQYLPALIGPARSGMIGLSATISPAYFANVTVRNTVDHPIPPREIAALPAPTGTVTQWSLSTPFDENRIAKTDRLRAPADERGLSWTGVAPTERGIVNIGIHDAITDKQNTAIGALTLVARTPRTVRVQFGFSDRVRVYVNGRLLYSADDSFRSRDYRFLGTVGLFDALYLPLDAGANSLWFAVSEGFGGWALTAAFDDLTGVTIAPGCGHLSCRDKPSP